MLIVGATAAGAVEYGAVVLFADRARAVDRRFALTDENASTVAEICRRLDGIPLAIELAAARVNVLPVRTLAEKLDQRLALLMARDRSAAPRHQTMRALIDWSYDLLSPAEQRLFERLSVFAGGCTLAAAISVCGDDGTEELEMVELLGSLVDKSLLVAEVYRDQPRYVLLETLREYAAERLARCGEQPFVAARHTLAYYDLAAGLERGLDTTLDPAWPSQIASELENWRSALEWTLTARGDVQLGQRLAAVLRPVWVNAAFAYDASDEGRRWVRTALDMVDDSTPLDIIASLDYAEAAIAFSFAEAQRALTSGARALARYRRMTEPRGTAGVVMIVGRTLLRLGQPAEAEPLLREGLDLARGLGARRLTGLLLEGMAWARSVIGRLDEARTYSVEALAIFREIRAADNAASVLLKSR